jgi:hypothetical protein
MHMVGTLGWGIVIIASLATVGGCKDSPKETCNKMCDKIIECLPAQLEDSLKSLPEAAREAAKKELEAGADQSRQDCKSKCSEQGKEVSEKDKKDLANAQKCLDEDCDGFAKCIERL